MMGTHNKEYSFVQKVWIAGGILALIAILVLLLQATISVLLLILAGTLIALYFRGLSDMIHRNTKWKQGICLAIATLGTLLLVTLLFWIIGAKVQSQIDELFDRLPKTVENAKQHFTQSAMGKKMVESFSSPNAKKAAQSFLQSFFTSTFGALANIYVVLFIGIYFTASPKIYKLGIVKLIPAAGRQKAQSILNDIGVNLKKWLKGKLFAMFVVFLLTSIGLAIIGVPTWLALALIAGILNFIPNFGPLIALAPAVLIALLQSPATALWVAALYIVVQVVESNFITPLVQQRLIKIPPALIIIAQLLMAALTGGWGLLLATPVMVILITVVKQLYLKRGVIGSGSHTPA